MPLLSFKMGRGLHMQLLIWSSNRETLCEHAAASRAGHISSMRRRARSSPGSSLTRPHLLPVLTIRTVRNHVTVAAAVWRIIEIEHKGPVVHSVGVHLPRDEKVACALRISIAVPIRQRSYGAELRDIHGKRRSSHTSPTELATSMDAPNYVRS